jgi:hypothetical protein
VATGLLLFLLKRTSGRRFLNSLGAGDTNQEVEMNQGIGMLMLAAGTLFAAGASRTFTGVITDTMCGASHTMESPASKCVRDCVHANPSAYKYALYDGRHVYVLSDQRAPEKFAAQKVAVRGVLDQETRTIQVESISAVK